MVWAGTRPYRLGLDVGSNSLGWFLVWLDGEGRPSALGPGGVRIYPDGRDPQSKTSNAVERRVARGARRRRDRYLKRRAKLMSLLVAHGLMPEDKAARKTLEALDPYELRAKALDAALPAHHVGRALFHLNQRRGFLSNRKTEKKDGESGVIREAAGKLQAAMENAGARTLGEFLHWQHRARRDVRARNRSTGAKAEYDFYPTRQMALDEFRAIWDTQAPHHPSMTAEARTAIGHAIFDQRPLQQPPVGKCSLDPARDTADAEGFRCPWAHPLAQRFRIWQEVRNLAIVETGRPDRALTKEDGNNIATILINDGKPSLTKDGKLSFDKIRLILGLPKDTRFNLESEKRQHLLGDQTAAKLSEKTLFGKTWRSFPLPRQIEIVSKLEEMQEPDATVGWLVANTGIDEVTANRVASALLPDGYSRLGLRAIKKLLQHMENGSTKTEAEALEYPGSQTASGELSASGLLPYYGEWLKDDVVGTGEVKDTIEKRWGRFPNPTVHVGLGQIRRVVNTLVREYGPPAEIAVEMTRDFKLSPKKLAALEKEQAENQRKNERRAEDIRKLGRAVNARNLLKMRLWEEQNTHDPLDRRCPYTGEVLSIERLLSEEVDIDHLIPFSDSWDDSAANKIVCMRYANRAKGNYTPFEAFGTSPTIDGRLYDWTATSLRAAELPHNKRWRFSPHARQRYDEMGGFLARQLNETGWLARVAKQYLTAVTHPHKIHVLPGKLTAMIRDKWALNTLLRDHNYSNAKNRRDHRHHAIDAMVAAMTDLSLLHRMSSVYDEERSKIEIPRPWPTLRDDLDARLRVMTVSHKPNHGLQAQLFKDTAYGAVKDPKREQEDNRKYLTCKGTLDDAMQKKAEAPANLVYRKMFLSLNMNEIGRIRDIRLRELVREHVKSKRPSSAPELKAALQAFAERTDIPSLPRGIRHVRLVDVKEPEYMVPVRRPSGEVYKSYFGGENAFVDIFEMPDGKWRGEAVSVFKANQRDAQMEWSNKFPSARFVMRIFKGDSIALDFNGQRMVMVVRQLDAAAGRFKLAAHNEGGPLQDRHESKKPEYKNDPFRWLMASYGTLKELKAERVRVDELGRLWRMRPDEAARTVS